jgi:hypothetical protein
MERRPGRVFSYDEALASFPVVRDRTEAAVRHVEALLNGLRSRDELERTREETEQAHREIVARWSAELESVGCVVKGLWLVDWDAGDGYFCWRYPEPTIGHFHSYDEGFAGRVPIV